MDKKDFRSEELEAELLDEKRRDLIEAGLLEDCEPDEEKETWCPECKGQHVIYLDCDLPGKGFWYCQRCGWKE